MRNEFVHVLLLAFAVIFLNWALAYVPYTYKDPASPPVPQQAQHVATSVQFIRCARQMLQQMMRECAVPLDDNKETEPDLVTQ